MTPSTSQLDGHMSVEAMGKIIRIDSESHDGDQSWVTIYQLLFGKSELVPTSGQYSAFLILHSIRTVAGLSLTDSAQTGKPRLSSRKSILRCSRT